MYSRKSKCITENEQYDPPEIRTVHRILRTSMYNRNLRVCKWKFKTDNAISEIGEDEIKSGNLEELESRYLTGASLGGIAVPVIMYVQMKK